MQAGLDAGQRRQDRTRVSGLSPFLLCLDVESAHGLAVEANAGHEIEWLAVGPRAGHRDDRAVPQSARDARRRPRQTDLLGKHIARPAGNDADRQSSCRHTGRDMAQRAVAAGRHHGVEFANGATPVENLEVFLRRLPNDIAALALEDRHDIVGDRAARQPCDGILIEQEARSIGTGRPAAAFVCHGCDKGLRPHTSSGAHSPKPRQIQDGNGRLIRCPKRRCPTNPIS